MNKIKLGNIFIILMWLCWFAAIILKTFSNTASLMLIGCWGVFAIASLTTTFLLIIDVRRRERELKEYEKHLDELIKGYLAASLESEKENMED